MQLSDRIRKTRKELGFSQLVFSNALGISRGHISKLEKGAAEPSEQLINLICITWGIDKDWLVNGHGELKIKWKSNISLEGAHDFTIEDLTEFKYNHLYNNLRLLADTVQRLAGHFKEQESFIDAIDDFVLEPGHHRNEQILKAIDNVEMQIEELKNRLNYIKEMKTYDRNGKVVPVSKKK